MQSGRGLLFVIVNYLLFVYGLFSKYSVSKHYVPYFTEFSGLMQQKNKQLLFISTVHLIVCWRWILVWCECSKYSPHKGSSIRGHLNIIVILYITKHVDNETVTSKQEFESINKCCITMLIQFSFNVQLMYSLCSTFDFIFHTPVLIYIACVIRINTHKSLKQFQFTLIHF